MEFKIDCSDFEFSNIGFESRDRNYDDPFAEVIETRNVCF